MFILKKMSVLILSLILVVLPLGGLHPASAQTLGDAITLSVQNKDGSEVVPLTTATISKNETAFQVLKNIVGNDKLGYTINPTYGSFITDIDGLKPTQPYYWGFFVNGADPGTGASTYKIKPGDDLLFKIVQWPTEMVNATVSLEGESVPANYQNKNVKVVQGASAYDAIKQAYKDSQIDAPIDDQYFAYIANIDQVIKDGQYFGIYFNKELAQTGVSSYKVKDGDVIQLKVTGNATETGSGDTNNQPETGNTTDQPLSVSKAILSQSITHTTQFILKNSIDTTYEAIGIRQAGQKVPQSYIDQLAKQLKDNNGKFRNVTDYENMVLGVTAAGGDATNFAGYNLIKEIYSNERMTNQGNNGPIYALLSYDSGQYKVPMNATWTREKLVNYLLKSQLKDGSWALFGDTGSPDITGMALSALAPYKSESGVKDAIDKAVAWLSTTQNADGGFGVDTNGGDSSESTAQVVIGLTAVNMDPTGGNFAKSKGNLITHLLQFQQKDGGFSHLQSDHVSNAIATAQDLVALTAYQNYLNGKAPAFQMNNRGLSVQPSIDRIGEPLPNTSTNAYNFIAFGALLVLVGSIVLFYRNRRV